MSEFDTFVKLHIYQMIADTAKAPSAREVAKAIDSSREAVEEAFQRLYQKRLLVLEPSAPDKIRMAPPFSGVETPFLVTVGEKSYYANCSWDALGVPAALHQDGDITTQDGFSGERMSLFIRSGRPVPQDCTAHFAVPAAHWWDDIIYT